MRQSSLVGVLVLLLIYGCSSSSPTLVNPPADDPAPSENAAPQLLELSLSDGATAVPIDTVIQAKFSEVLDPATLTAESFSLLRDDVPVAGSFETQGPLVLFRPAQALDFNSSYRLALSAELADIQGGRLANPAAVNFSTEIFSSTLPIVLIDSGGLNIRDEPKIPARMRIIYREGEASSLDDPAENYDGSIGIEIRGTLSQAFLKKQYGFETWDEAGEDLKVELLGFPEESDWILQASYIDRSFLRNYLAYETSRELGRYASRARFVELFLNQRGDDDHTREYRGVYLLLEKIKRDGERVDIKKLEPDQNSLPQISGGYILAIDRIGPDDLPLITAAGTQTIVVYPDPKDISPDQFAWIQAYLNQFEAALAGADFQDPDLGYAAYLDVDAFIDFFLINEVLRNPDAFLYSTFFWLFSRLSG